MVDTIEELQAKMEAAALTLDFEKAKRLRDRINLIRGGATPSDAEQADLSGLTRQQPGAMGLGSSQARPETPAGWKRPPKPDPLTKGSSRRAR